MTFERNYFHLAAKTSLNVINVFLGDVRVSRARVRRGTKRVGIANELTNGVTSRRIIQLHTLKAGIAFFGAKYILHTHSHTHTLFIELIR